jgi:hypothetical protein
MPSSSLIPLLPLSSLHPFPRSSRITKKKEVRISTLQRWLRARSRRRRRRPRRPSRPLRPRRPRHHHVRIRLRRDTLRLLLIAHADRQRLVAARIRRLRARVVLVIARAYAGGLEVGEGRPVDFEGRFAVASLGYLVLSASPSQPETSFNAERHTGSAAAPPRAPVNACSLVKVCSVMAGGGRDVLVNSCQFPLPPKHQLGQALS